jgi:hypothetical protein
MSDLTTATQHRRLAVLKHLQTATEYTSNASILGDVLQSVGVPATSDQLASTLSWLDEQELVILRAYDTLIIAKATQRGCEVALGKAAHPGVKRPSAG